MPYAYQALGRVSDGEAGRTPVIGMAAGKLNGHCFTSTLDCCTKGPRGE